MVHGNPSKRQPCTWSMLIRSSELHRAYPQNETAHYSLIRNRYSFTFFVSVNSTTTTKDNNNKKKKKKKKENATFVVLAGDYGGWEMNDRQMDR